MNKLLCQSCGNQNKENLFFCERCGNKLETRNPFSIINPPEMSETGSNQQSGAHSGEMFGSLSDYDEPSEGSSIGGNVIIGICIACSLILFGGLISSIVAYIVYFPFRKRENGWVFFVVTYLFTATITTFLFR